MKERIKKQLEILILGSVKVLCTIYWTTFMFLVATFFYLVCILFMPRKFKRINEELNKAYFVPINNLWKIK